MLKRIAAIVSMLFIYASSAPAQISACGAQPKNVPIEVQQRIQGDIEDEVQRFPGLLGDDQLKGKVDTSRFEICEKHKDVDKSQIDVYMIWVSCQIIMGDHGLSATERSKLWIDIYRELGRAWTPAAAEGCVLIAPPIERTARSEPLARSPLFPQNREKPGAFVVADETAVGVVKQYDSKSHELTTIPMYPYVGETAEASRRFRFFQEVVADKLRILPSRFGSVIESMYLKRLTVAPVKTANSPSVDEVQGCWKNFEALEVMHGFIVQRAENEFWALSRIFIAISQKTLG